jgi:hypothetical protein
MMLVLSATGAPVALVNLVVIMFDSCVYDEGGGLSMPSWPTP